MPGLTKMCNLRTQHANLTDEELLKNAEPMRSSSPVIEELCQRLEKHIDQAAELSKIETTQHQCPECDCAVQVHYIAEENKLTLERAPA